MKVRWKALSIILGSAIIIAIGCKSGKTDATADEKAEPIAVEVHSAPFSRSFTNLLSAYYDLHDGFVKSDSTKVNAAAASLRLQVNNLKLAELEGDTTGTIRETAAFFAATISASASAITGKDAIEQKRREFNMISDALWNLTRTVRYDGQKVYYQFCSEAFENTGGYWLSSSRDVHNPYDNIKTADCGEVTDSVDYRRQ